MNKKQITVMAILTLVLAFMDISGLPMTTGVSFVQSISFKTFPCLLAFYICRYCLHAIR